MILDDTIRYGSQVATATRDGVQIGRFVAEALHIGDDNNGYAVIQSDSVVAGDNIAFTMIDKKVTLTVARVSIDQKQRNYRRELLTFGSMTLDEARRLITAL